ncbi:glutathione S-transferase N-terminal domain-containing protein [Roseivivax marinus]|uniref:glutathione S-transferase family protein n=1 Tax=Roseivivax marinus TaxID=1379903 RepID=UPI001F041925|nr:glutathione S-transferase N-terminal domain-containing protein [Roseivivax marinus]UMA64914.1 glutathione S-transferase N-terminal domain-containing protein [Roseivivax marinus]
MTDLHDLWHDPGTRVVLRSTETSPFGRKVRMAAEILGLAGRIERQAADTLDTSDTLRAQNPLGKMPCLLIGEEAVFDSAVILELLDAVAGGGRLAPRAGLARFRVLTRARLADGIADAALLMVYEGRFRQEGAPVGERWLAHQRGKVERGLSVFETSPPPAERADLVSITLSAALGYLDWREPVAWRPGHPRLARWLDDFAAATPAFEHTARSVA